MIFDWYGADDISFFAIERDVSHLAQVFLNMSEQDPELQAELTELIFDADGNKLLKDNKVFPHEFYIPGQTAVIVAGFVP